MTICTLTVEPNYILRIGIGDKRTNASIRNSLRNSITRNHLVAPFRSYSIPGTGMLPKQPTHFNSSIFSCDEEYRRACRCTSRALRDYGVSLLRHQHVRHIKTFRDTASRAIQQDDWKSVRPRLQRRFFAWIGRNRRLAKDFEASIDSARAFLYGGQCPWRAADTARSRAIPHRSHRSGSANRCGYSSCGWLGSTWHLRIGVSNRSESRRLQSLNPFETAS
jgi:hypothetical protein